MNVTLRPAGTTSRRPRAIAEKIALGAAVVGALIATSGVALLAALGNPIELSSLLSYACWLGCVAALAIRPRGVPLASAGLSTVVLILLVNQPYATGSLLNPSGNYGHFAGVAVILTSDLIVLAGSLAAVIRIDERKGTSCRP